MAEAVKYGFYTVNPDYLEYLSKIDSEVYYNPLYRNSIKPFVGIIKVEKLYQKQKETGIIRKANCNFSELERAMLDWK